MTKHFDAQSLMAAGARLVSMDGSPVFVLKAQPTQGDVHINTPLTNISVAFMQNPVNFIADKVFPNVPVSKQSDAYYVYDRGFFNRNEMEKRAPGTESKGVGYQLSNTSYFCSVAAIHHDIPDQVRANADSMIGPDRDAAALLAHQSLIYKESLWASTFFTTGIWGTNIAGTTGVPVPGTSALVWSDASSTPIEDVRTAKRTMAGSTGFEPNKLVLGRAVYDTLLDHPDIVDRIKYGQTAGAPAKTSRQALMGLLEVDEILVMNGIQNTAKEGQTNAHSFIGGNHALLAYAPATPGLMVPSAGYTFAWTGYLGASEGGARVRRFRMENIGSDRVELEVAFQQKTISTELGYFFSSIV
jgi:hypothetical protein